MLTITDYKMIYRPWTFMFWKWGAKLGPLSIVTYEMDWLTHVIEFHWFNKWKCAITFEFPRKVEENDYSRR